VTKEGGAQYRGNFRILSDEITRGTADYGYNQLQTNVGGPVPMIGQPVFPRLGRVAGFCRPFPDPCGRGISRDQPGLRRPPE